MKRNGLNNSKKKTVKFIIGTLTCVCAVLYQPPIPMGSSDTISVTQEITALAMTQEISQVSAELETVKGNTIPLSAYTYNGEENELNE